MSKLKSVVQFVMLFGLLAMGAGAGAQELLQNAQTGMIQDLGQSDGFLVISGQRYDYDRETTSITWQGEELDDAYLERGMVLRFTVRNNMLIRVQVLGPAKILEDINEH